MRDKPPYRVPLISEIAEIPWNGFTVASTFAGAGGSSTGYRMAGFKVIYANEFVPIAQESYKANCMPYTVVDGRDVKTVKGADILAAGGLKVGELDIFDGSPPCQAFSTAGRREKGWGTDKVYEHGAAQKNEQLFDEYIRLRDEMMPRVFVAENVSGLVKGTAKGFFIEIMTQLRKGYRIEARMLDAQWLGVPQARQRIMIVGVRDDLELDPVFPRPLPYRYSVRDALPWLGGVKMITAGNERHTDAGRRPTWDADTEPSPTIMATEAGASYYDSRVVHSTSGQHKIRGDVTDRPSPVITAHRPASLSVVQNSNATHSRKGEHRSVDDPAPTLLARRANIEVENILEPETDISRQAIGREYDKLNPGQQSDKYFSLVRADAEEPCPTITAAGGQNSGIATVVHPTEKRKFTILEVKRLCSFSDDFVLKGSYGQMWERLGNSVPPVMMSHVASAIRDGILAPLRDSGRIPDRRGECEGQHASGSGRRSTSEKRTSAGRGRRPAPEAATATSGSVAGAASSRRTSSRSKKSSGAGSGKG